MTATVIDGKAIAAETRAQVAVDPVWSALRFRALKGGEPPFTGGK